MTTATGERIEYAWNSRNLLSTVTYRDPAATTTKHVTHDVWNRRIGRSIDQDSDRSIDRTARFLYENPGRLTPARAFNRHVR